jgi:uncharacterized integral membrane protein
MMRVIHSALLMLFVAAVVVFCLENLEMLEVNFLSWHIRLPTPVLIILVYLLGMVSGWSVVKFLRTSFQSEPAKAK